MARVLVVGGAGYIGSHMVKALTGSGQDVIVLDDFSTGHRDAVRGAELVEGSAGDAVVLGKMFSTRTVDVVMHFASFIDVAESVRYPEKYYRNNVRNTLALLDGMKRHGVNRFIFSSSAAVYGGVASGPIAEDQPCVPVNPYGLSKLQVERALRERSEADGLRYVSLRYFNAAGADPEGGLGERHDPETHLIPLVLQVASGRREAIQVFGNDYPTQDGTCIRDYIHVCDLCDAHRLAMKHLLAGGDSRVYNLGNGNGFSVRQVIDAARRVTGKDIPARDMPRRAGDPAILVASAAAIRSELGWAPSRAKLETIIQDAWKWELRQRR